MQITLCFGIYVKGEDGERVGSVHYLAAENHWNMKTSLECKRFSLHTQVQYDYLVSNLESERAKDPKAEEVAAKPPLPRAARCKTHHPFRLGSSTGSSSNSDKVFFELRAPWVMPIRR